MFRLRQPLRRLTWVALIAIFGLALAPTISHALAHAQGGSVWAEVCTPQGMKLVAAADASADVDADGQPAPADGTASLNHLEHCPLCGLSGAALALPPAPVALTLPLTSASLVPRLFLRAPRPMFSWAPAQPRAPPAAA